MTRRVQVVAMAAGASGRSVAPGRPRRTVFGAAVRVVLLALRAVTGALWAV